MISNRLVFFISTTLVQAMFTELWSLAQLTCFLLQLWLQQ